MNPHTRERFDVVVLGVGTMGSATCFEIARRAGNATKNVSGLSILGLEQHSIPNALGSHHGDSRMIRLCYYEHPSYVPLLLRAYELWEDIEQISGRDLLHITGGIYMGPPDAEIHPTAELVPGTLRAAIEHGLPHERLSPDELRGRYPMFHISGDYEGVFETRAGLLRPEAVVETYADQAMRCGAVLKSHERVRQWIAEEKRVIIETERATYEASHLIICGGAWAVQLLGEIGVKLTVTRQVLGWFWPKQPERFEIGAFPVWGLDDPPRGPGLVYGFPIIPGRPGLKIARHFPAQPVAPETVDRTPSDADRAEVEQLITDVFPDYAGPLLSLAICLYTNTPDAHFIIDRHPQHENVTFAAGFSGHGFKFASVIGEVMADLTLDGGTRHPIDFVRLSRFTNSTLR